MNYLSKDQRNWVLGDQEHLVQILTNPKGNTSCI